MDKGYDWHCLQSATDGKLLENLCTGPLIIKKKLSL